MSCAINGCGTPTPLVTGESHPGGMVVDALNIYWVNGTSIMQLAK
jgi:hypothetical protein